VETVGATLDNAVFAKPMESWLTHHREAPHVLLGGGVTTAGLMLAACSGRGLR
jgi:hypothetical protein